ncbi:MULTISPECIES: MerR family transcriptional regulator [Rhodobacterales]|jgi:MerR family mercuric resistance operon transcriptional regulator|uniref:MerR family mercuric resistance operon transcriptional regulator n=3 Tax=Rhodobacterales TaxID=204455 RepID=A0A840CME5_9RHOB|nr:MULTISPECIES: helix-turn-helix domain-containing protein [Rhodobacterales]ALG92341.1 MerR family transcriptional regulator [Actibacterium sp. EMB200-NS6]KEP68768.1 MerR family transcriptional regulator [Thioclava dalianensis]MBB4023906.1 MerR family mercuric resistance operon transcriptional regulator [Actibacterium naphthalenivorans]MBN9889515.1 helix-turn-helix domain-containing protein [Salipiger abyssi]PTQ67768.1 MerR family mercuric resistance operon transcriptional regulator [Celeriba
MIDHESESSLTRGDLARATGCNIETIRYYEKTGLLPDPPRSAAGYRIYSAAHATRLRFILRARELGFSMEDIRGLMGLNDGAAPTCAEVKERTERHLADVRAKISDLRRIESVLAATASRCSGAEVPNCPVLDAISGN